jgi:hypothetical protein
MSLIGRFDHVTCKEDTQAITSCQRRSSVLTFSVTTVMITFVQYSTLDTRAHSFSVALDFPPFILAVTRRSLPGP